MSCSTTSRPGLQSDQVLAPFCVAEGLPFADVLSAADIDAAFAAEKVTFGATAKSVWTPALTLWTLLSQVVHKDKSCRAAVLRTAVLLLALERGPCASDTAAYCRARAKLPVEVLRRLAVDVARNLERAAPAAWRWHNRPTYLVDGTTLTMPDTAANQEAYPQSPNQKKGIGFPILRLVVLLSLATAAVYGMAMGPYRGKETGETALLRQLLEQLTAGDVLVGDRYYCSYWLVAMGQQRGVDVVFRLHQKRKYDFRRGQRLGDGDHVVVWHKPKRPPWMDAATYAAVPESLRVRELRVPIAKPGCRVQELVIATTLTDAEAYAKDDIADLYKDRWQVELDLRALKQSLGIDQLRCKTPAMVAKELWATFLGYNLLRKVAAQAAREQGLQARQVSFTATQQALAATWGSWTVAAAPTRATQGRQVLQVLGKEIVGDRPDRYEPRAVKRRPKEYDRLMQPRAEAKAELLRKRQRKDRR